MAVDIDLLQLERAITGLTAAIREGSETQENIRESLYTIAEAFGGAADINYLESIALSLDRICLRLERNDQPRRRSKRRGNLKAVG
jgi:hypothetical protein